MKKSDRKRFWKGPSIFLLSSTLALGIIENGGTLVQAAEQKSDKILSEQEAIKFAKKWMDVPARFEYGYGQYIEPYGALRTPYGAWSLYWSHPNQASIGYKIHPVTGRLLGYSYQDEYSQANNPAIMDSKLALEGAMKFLTKILSPEELLELAEPEEDVYKSKGYHFKFMRVKNTIPFERNWISVITRGDGKVLHFERVWSDGEMPDTSKIISEKKARELLEQNTQPTMQYNRVYTGKDESKYMLVYDYLPTDSQFVDAITGEMIDAKGRVAKPSPIKGLKEMPLVSAPTAGKGMNGVLTLEQVEASAIYFLQTTYPDRLADIYMLDSQPYYVESYNGSQRWEDHHVNFGWLKNGILIGDRDSNFSLYVNPRTGESGYGKDPLAPPVIDDNDKQRVDMATAKKTEQAMKKSLELYYFQPENDLYEDEEPKPRLVYRLSGAFGVVNAHTGKWISSQ
ncbi:YcdB/YcdC domain-containing protein [Brevibacillus reuszeri]|uniref:YcdB/YcdC domain-containing protein n=1 Tax=Brevibacillus reuszeri TaxID=54915 RepID=UPI00289D8008|nr:YcdB/YcdC domain-containing protein [Brevibacillus reuszeri]